MQEISKCLCFRYAPARYFLNFPQAIFQFLFQSVSLPDGRCGDTSMSPHLKIFNLRSNNLLDVYPKDLL